MSLEEAVLNQLVKEVSLKAKNLMLTRMAKLAETYVDLLNASMGIQSSKGNLLWQWKLDLSYPHTKDEECYLNSIGGEHHDGVYTSENLPPFPSHVNCKCKLVTLNDPATLEEQGGWKVVINDRGVTFVNNSDKYKNMKEGTAPQVKGKVVVKTGTDPNDFDTPIINKFIAEVDHIAKQVASEISGK